MSEQSVRLFVDMDGVTAIWNTEASLEDTFKPGYFLNRDPEKKLISAIQRLLDQGYKITILTAAYNERAAKEKFEWISKHFNAVIYDSDYDPAYHRLEEKPALQVIIVEYGSNKADAIPLTLFEKKNILLDDFSKNLHEWEEAGSEYVGFKWLNGINGTKGSWTGHTIDHRMSEDMQYISLKAIMDYYAA